MTAECSVAGTGKANCAPSEPFRQWEQIDENARFEKHLPDHASLGYE